jgi:hypothetical protein
MFERSYSIPEINVFTKKRPFEIEGVRIIQPFYPTRKMTAQSGLFTIHGDPSQNLAELRSDGSLITDIRNGKKWVIESESKPEILRQLIRLGIYSRTLFPDLAGLAIGLLEVETIRNMDEYNELAHKGFAEE